MWIIENIWSFQVFFHSASDQLLNHFPKSVLPVDYGGDLKDYYMEDYIKEANKDYGQCTMEGQPNYFWCLSGKDVVYIKS